MMTQQKKNMTLIPHPLLMEKREGVFKIDNETVFVLDPGAAELTMIPALEVLGCEKDSQILQKDSCRPLEELSESWLSDIRKKCRVSLPIQSAEGSEPCISVILFDDIAGMDKNIEAYDLEISAKKILIRASGGPGIYYALQSLLQLSDESGSVPACHINDRPRFPWRGLHLDSGRFYQPLEEIKSFLDTMALHKMNILHWHLTEDQGWRLEIKKFPLLTEIGSRRKETVWGHIAAPGKKEEDGVPHKGFYSQDEVREIVAYARDRGIMIVPEIDLPGHSRAAIAAYPELGVEGRKMDVFTLWGVCKDIYNPEEKTITFLEDVMEEVLELFPSPWIHIGGDEAVKDQWKSSARVKELIKERGLKDNHEMQSWFIKRIAAYLKGRGRKTIGWDEIMEGGAPEDAVIMGWRHEKQGIAAAQNGLPVLMCPCQSTYLDYRESRGPYEPVTITSGYNMFMVKNLEHFYNWNPLPPVLKEEEKKLIMGGQGQVWTEYMPEASMLQYLTWPRASALAEVLWSPEEKRDFTDFEGRLQGLLNLLDRKKISYHFRGDLRKGGILKSSSSEWKEQTVPLNKKMASEAGRIQLLFKRKGFRSFSQIEEVRLETADGRVYKESHTGYTGRFNRLNIYTLGDGTPFSFEGSRLIIRSRACSRVPAKTASGIRDSRLQWAFRIAPH
jgi:hexosaminidase